MTESQRKTLASMAPNMNIHHMETIAVAIGSSLDGMPNEFFQSIANLAIRMGADRLKDYHESLIA